MGFLMNKIHKAHGISSVFLEKILEIVVSNQTIEEKASNLNLNYMSKFC